ncbi:uncharacterized protein KY384_003245 [Bacidia gigantensis]|uniref:uncharacterized protein n=1 Tax=Bacidia gigantensis TaxID=2732470 RepID=UPI001D043FA3|nr:uncharacterized protein KY384_003245 [Bacidia gigantensis]KAG8531614.1 hypothetical protein KY384_003245 [Bacidia gigantensis]
MNFVPQESQGDQEEYIQYLKALVYELVKHHSQDHENCQFLPSARLPTNRTALVATQSDPLPRTSKRPQKRGFANEDESSEGLRFISWQPSNQPPKPRDTGTNSWMPLAKKLVDITPLAADWWKKAEFFNLETIMQGGVAAQFVLDGSTKTLSIPRQKEIEVSYNYGAEECWLLSAAKGYAETAANRALTVECVLMLVNFQKFIVLCICAVLSQMGASKAALVDITRICFGDVSEEYALRLWRTAIFLNQLVDGLGFRGWGNRASELLLIWNRPPPYYVHLAWAPKAALEYLTANLSTNLHTQGVDEREGWTSLFIPSLIYNVLGQKIE